MLLSVVMFTLPLLTLSGCNSDNSSSEGVEDTMPVSTQSAQATDNNNNQAPIAFDDVVVLQSNETITITLVATDNENSPLTFSIGNEPENGAISQNENIIIYTTHNNFIGSDNFTFIANDGDDNSNIATISIEVLSPSLTTTLLDGSIVDTAMLVSLGNQLYHDTNLSTPIGQSCANCHDLNSGFDDPNTANPTSVGADGRSFGTRNYPTASYSAHIPEPQNRIAGGPQGLIGGLFLDGRAASLEEQAKGPFLNPIEMGNASVNEVISKIAQSSYATEFELLFGEGIFLDTERAYNYVADAIAAFERSPVFSPFTSKFDRVQAGIATFTSAERQGQDIFNNKGDCRRCHSTNAATAIAETNTPEIFSDFSYKNIGVPSNPLLPAFIEDPLFIDLGLGAQSGNDRNNGQFRVSTLRNIANRAPYMHNGVFSSLSEVINFYNTRDTSFTDVPEVNQNIDQGGRIGELNLTDNEIENLIAFLETLTDE
ncbi:cytochrome c peroxidase [Colwellia psychrerythraea]|uniref:cytochrome c peroxidase n=1 Tax=Colwellia psychrerythraea TaxID=28229 RepID=UPI00167FDE93|nr:cytochrome c peroxidase [Colwellia psychrerythraea]